MTEHSTGLTTVDLLWLVGAMLALISFFLHRLLSQFDTLNTAVTQLNSTMMKIDKDLTNEIVTLKATQLRHADEIRGLNSVYDRLRVTETHVSFLQAKCEEVTGSKAK